MIVIACSQQQGGEAEPCYPNGTCNAGLTCASNLCVKLPGDAGADVSTGQDSGQDAGTDTGSSQDAGDGEAGPARTFTRVFVTSQTYAGNFGSAMAADTVCQTLADGAKLGGTWLAWISSSTSDAATRFTHSTLPYKLLDGTVIANDWTGLASSLHAAAISLDETMTAQTGTVWTGTSTSGTVQNTTCTDWSTNAGTGQTGSSQGITGSGWTFAQSQPCTNMNRLYCFEQ